MFRRNRNQLKSKYKLSEDDFREMLINQYFKCKICERKGLPLEVDNDHETGRIRGLLCHQCNAALARFKRGKLGRCHLVEPEKEFRIYLSRKTELVSGFERAALRIMKRTL